MAAAPGYVRWFSEIGSGDLALVGGKNASLGEMYQELQAEGVPVPNGFALTTHAYRELVDSGLPREALNAALEDVDVMDVTSLARCGRACRPRAASSPPPCGSDPHRRAAAWRRF